MTNTDVCIQTEDEIAAEIRNGARPSYPKLLVTTHTLAEVGTNGLPTTDYNRSLFEFDEDLSSALESSSLGLTVLIETFGGKRSYYGYVQADFPLEDMEHRFGSRYPRHALTWELSDDPTWRLLRTYSTDYSFYEGAPNETESVYPDDADGDALRAVAADGSDMSQPIQVDFMVAAPDEPSARSIGAALVSAGYEIDVGRGDGWGTHGNADE